MTGHRTSEVATEIVTEGRPGHGPRTVVRMSWRRADPLAVTLAITTEPDHPALPRGEWAVLRDFLRYGLEVPTGDGGVRIRPDPGGQAVWLELPGGHRPCLVRLDAVAVRSFLDRTDALVPAGEERGALDLDALIERLLSG